MAKSEDGPAYYTDVYYDILDDDYCLFTVYRFEKKETAEQFIAQVPFVCSDIQYDPRKRTDDGHTDKYPYRPRFTNLEDAIADAKEFHEYGDKQEYKYHGRVFQVELSVMEKLHDKNIIKKLTQENNEMKSKIVRLEAELKCLTT
jgi:hypothetical protein